jgi:hypothetical protein
MAPISFYLIKEIEMIFIILLAVLNFMIPSAAYGQEQSRLYPSPEFSSRYFAIGVGMLPFSEKIKEESMIGNGSGISFEFGYAYKDRWAFNGGIGFLGADDKGEQFTRMVCPAYTGSFCSNPKEKESSLNIYSISAETGLQHRMSLIKVHHKMFLLIGGYVGYRGILVSREITNCSDCGGDSQYYNGAYIAPMIALGGNYSKLKDIYLYARYENFVSGDEMAPAWWIGLARSRHY